MLKLYFDSQKIPGRCELAYGSAFYSKTDPGTYTKLRTPGSGAGQGRKKYNLTTENNPGTGEKSGTATKIFF
jgi:hypothetical protein